MEVPLFFKGLFLGFSIAAPVGPIGLLCIQRTLLGGMMNGLVSGLGAATADALYGLTAALGLTVVSDMLVSHQGWFRVVGGLFLCSLGLRAFRSKPASQAAATRQTGSGYLSSYGTTFLLTLTNPMTILSFAAIFAGLGIITTSGHYGTAAILVSGVFLGSGAWWCLLCGIVGRFHGKLETRRLAWINRLSGIAIMTFGIVAIISGII